MEKLPDDVESVSDVMMFSLDVIREYLHVCSHENENPTAWGLLVYCQQSKGIGCFSQKPGDSLTERMNKDELFKDETIQ